jgi:TetR/AcrR family transcriptional regulator, mexJK operon transcriptional repressor
MAAERRSTTSTAPGRDASEVVPLDPRVVRSRVAIVAAATEHFLEHGYVAASVDDIALRAGVAKRTVYNIFGGKEQLFRAILREAIETAETFSTRAAASLGETDDVAAELTEAASELARAVLGGRIVPLRRLLIGEATRFPELARDYHRRAPGRVMATLADALHRYDARGLLRVDDPELAAEHLAFLVLGASLDSALFEVAGATSPQEVDRRATAGAAAFLRAYAPRG